MFLFFFCVKVGDICIRDEDEVATKGVGARNERHLCAINYNVRTGIEIVVGLLDNIMAGMKIPAGEEGSSQGYYLKGEDRK